LLDFNIEDHLQLPMDDDDQDTMINNTNLHASSSSNTYDLAGACPELDASSNKKQKSKMAFMMCQVPGCKVDISELKGYHKRHRVCLTCANASNVVIDGIHKRYCQQCGK
nr:squamosa promoter-binding-like protein 7 [Tanacetum cinerariifolium]